MKYITLLVLVIVTTACTPARLQPLPISTDNRQAQVTIYRQPAFLGSGAKIVYGANSFDYGELWSGGYKPLVLPPGEYTFFVRGTGGDKPHKLQMVLANGDNRCLMSRVNPALYGSMWIPFMHYFMHAALVQETPCLAEAEARQYRLHDE